MRKKGFTLIELLVVIAIIALLLSIMLPSLKKAKRYARRVIDTTNLRSLSTALHIYLNNSKDKFFDYGSGVLWMDRIGGIVDNMDEIRFCPETIAKTQDVVNDWNTTNESKWGTSLKPWLWNRSNNPSEQYEMGSYALNGWFYAPCKTDNSCLMCDAIRSGPDFANRVYGTRTAVRSPSTTPFVLDAWWVDGWPRNTDVLPATGYNYTADPDIGPVDRGGSLVSSATMMGRFVMDRHGPETQVIFLDGQVQTIPHKDLWTLTWHRGSRPNFNAVVPQPAPTKR